MINNNHYTNDCNDAFETNPRTGTLILKSIKCILSILLN